MFFSALSPPSITSWYRRRKPRNVLILHPRPSGCSLLSSLLDGTQCTPRVSVDGRAANQSGREKLITFFFFLHAPRKLPARGGEGCEDVSFPRFITFHGSREEGSSAVLIKHDSFSYKTPASSGTLVIMRFQFSLAREKKEVPRA